MNATGTIAKLEAILARVRSRVGEPRHVAPHTTAVHAAVALPAAAELLEDEDSEQPTLPPPPVVETAAVAEAPEVAAFAGPPAVAVSPVPHEPHEPPAPRAPVLELSVDIDAGMDDPSAPAPAETVQVPEPVPAVAEALSSQERLVVVDPVSADQAPAEGPEVIEVSHTSEPAEALDPAVMPEPPADEHVDEPPASSRRPLAPQPEERLAEMAFGAAEPRPPLHTPPPESGRLPAAPAAEFPDEDTGVHPAAPPASAVLAAEATRADLTGTERVASIQGGVRAFQPATFAELLDASLGL